MKIINSVHPADFKSYDTALIRERFLAEGLARPDQINLVYTHYDRMILGAANPVLQTLALSTYPILRSGYFLERRELGIINVGGDGEVTANNITYTLKKLDCLYLGKQTKGVAFKVKDEQNPPVFYLLSTPAHAIYPATLMTHSEAVKVTLGDPSTANLRTINKYIHAQGIASCQLVMGLTILHSGNVWNTMPAHVHDRRTEVYFYFDVLQDQRVFHFMGEGTETRHIVAGNNEAVVSPPWSIHSGAGTAGYSFIWGMGGENQDYTDMDPVALKDIR